MITEWKLSDIIFIVVLCLFALAICVFLLLTIGV